MIDMTEKNDIEKEILKQLTLDSRQSYRDIAKKLDISHVSVSAKVKSLEEKGIIKGYTAVIDPNNMNYYPLCLRISAAQGGDLSKIGRRISDYEDINVVMRVSGDCELLALAMCSDRESALRLLDEINSVPGVGKAESHIVLDALKMGGHRLKP